MNTDLEQVLNLLPQPSFFVQQGRVTWCSIAARFSLSLGAPLSLVLGSSEYLYTQWSHTGTLQLPLHLFGKDYTACVQPLADGDLFLTKPYESDARSIAVNAMESLSVALCQPLHALLNASRSLFDLLDGATDEKIIDSSAHLNRTIYQLSRLYTELADGGRLLQHRMEAVRLPTQMQKYLQNFFDDAKSLAEAAGICFVYQPLRAPITADVDTSLLTLALYNLLANALSNMPNGGTITLSAEKQSEFLQITLHDSGEGLSAEAAAALFSHYYEQLNAEPRLRLGLGLPVSREVAHLHGGTLSLSSDAQCGTTVSLLLSLTPCPIDLNSRRIIVPERASLHPGLVALSDSLPASHYRPDEVE